MSDEPTRAVPFVGRVLSELYDEYRTAQIARLAMEASELAHRVERLGGLDGIAGDLRLVRSLLEQAGRMERTSEPAPP